MSEAGGGVMIDDSQFISKTFVVGGDPGDTVSGVAAFASGSPSVSIWNPAGTGKDIIPISFDLFSDTPAPSVAPSIFLCTDNKNRVSSGGEAVTPVSPYAGGGYTPDGSIIFTLWTPGNSIVANASGAAKFITPLKLVGGSSGLGFNYRIKNLVRIKPGNSALIYIVGAGLYRMGLWYREADV